MGLPIWSASLSNYSLLISGSLLVIAGLLSVATFIQPAIRRVLPSGCLACRRPIRYRQRLRSHDDELEVEVDLERVEAATLASLGGSELSVRDLTVRFGGVTAVSGVSLSAKPGEITALIGPNGSGKTSLLNLISGFYQPSSGHVVLGDTDITKMGIAHRAKLGVSRMFGSRRCRPTSLSTMW